MFDTTVLHSVLKFSIMGIEQETKRNELVERRKGVFKRKLMGTLK